MMFLHPSLQIQKTAHRGWGVFTTTTLKKHEVIEISPVVVMSATERKLLDQTLLHDYIFEWVDGACCMGMGYLPVYNHRVPSNCEYFQDYEQGLMFVKTVRAIESGEELCINYQGDFDNKKPVWFEVME